MVAQDQNEASVQLVTWDLVRPSWAARKMALISSGFAKLGDVIKSVMVSLPFANGFSDGMGHSGFIVT